VRIDQLLARLSETEACGFEDLFADVSERSGLIVTFLALLEMIRLKLVRVFQSASFGPIRVYKRIAVKVVDVYGNESTVLRDLA
jgi:segregation and condensation protein A